MPQSVNAATRVMIDKELIYQTRFGQLADIRLLLDRGADPEQLNEAGWPMVSVAASRVDGLSVPILRELIKRGANINEGGPSRMYPVIVAARRGDEEQMDFLLYEALADSTATDPNGVTASEIARLNGHDEMAAKIEKIQAERKQTVAAMYSLERRDGLMRESVLSSCAITYLDYYFKSKQDKLDPATQAEKVGDWKSRNSVAGSDLQQIFRIPVGSVIGLGQLASVRLRSELDAMISNRNRRTHGVGADGDVEKRCGRISDQVLADSAAQTKAIKDKAEAKSKSMRRPY